MSKRRSRFIGKCLALFLPAAFVFGIIYEQLGRQRDRKRFPPIGRSVDVGGRRLNINCSGRGTPAVVFESASGIGLEWQQIQSQVSKFTEACWYDRAGMGWSDTGPFPRTSVAIADDLHKLLRNAGVPAPYVLVGFSFGGLPTRVYSQRYAKEVSGLVLVDSAQEDEPRRAPRFYLGHSAPRWLWHPIDLGLRIASFTGLIRFTQASAMQSRNPPQMTADQIIGALRQQPKSFATGASTGITEPLSYLEAASVHDLGNLELIVLTAGRSQDFRNADLNRQAADYQQIWIHELQPKLVRLSTQGRQVVVENCDHNIPSQAPNVVIDAIREVVTASGSSKREH
jgi:pimeloyl-ACP methyl ester carboxylesterase